MFEKPQLFYAPAGSARPRGEARVLLWDRRASSRLHMSPEARVYSSPCSVLLSAVCSEGKSEAAVMVTTWRPSSLSFSVIGCVRECEGLWCCGVVECGWRREWRLLSPLTAGYPHPALHPTSRSPALPARMLARECQVRSNTSPLPNFPTFTPVLVRPHTLTLRR
ncbi:hypothetical protein E2C01_013130 [Portunus trituberculatus]|uniref:Uncharacterized protein n=1 Tax=Portunus trituberculatus TaxID=210409 RepID=A0A5B7DG99_PORTR|nr:hypothetical protein [Portunus trituberculatus]